jgi:hypothetical protein
MSEFDTFIDAATVSEQNDIATQRVTHGVQNSLPDFRSALTIKVFKAGFSRPLSS